MMDPLKIQRLVDGELSRVETRNLLKLAQDDWQAWQEIAAAFIEDRVWQTEFQANSQDDWGGNPPKETAPAPLPGQVSGSATSFGHSTTRWLSIAASVLIALAAGFYLGQLSGTARVSPAGVADAAPAMPDSTGAKNDLSVVNYRPDYHMQLQDDKGNLMNTEIPLYDAETALQAGYDMRPGRLSDEARQMYVDSGFQVKQDIEYMSGRLQDGRTFVVPFQTINLSPGQ